MWLSKSRGRLASGWWGASPSGNRGRSVCCRREFEDALAHQFLGILEELFVDGREGGPVLDVAHRVLEADRRGRERVVIVGVVGERLPDRRPGRGQVVGIDRVSEGQKAQFLELPALAVGESCHTLQGRTGDKGISAPKP